MYVARLSRCFYRIRCDIYSACEIRLNPKSIKHFLLNKGNDAIWCKHISLLTVSQHVTLLQILWMWDCNSFVHSKRNTHSFCIMSAIYNTIVLHKTATCLQLSSCQGKRAILAGQSVLDWPPWGLALVPDCAKDTSQLSDLWSDLKKNRQTVMFVLWQRSHGSQRSALPQKYYQYSLSPPGLERMAPKKN